MNDRTKKWLMRFGIGCIITGLVIGLLVEGHRYSLKNSSSPTPPTPVQVPVSSSGSGTSWLMLAIIIIAAPFVLAGGIFLAVKLIHDRRNRVNSTKTATAPAAPAAPTPTTSGEKKGPSIGKILSYGVLACVIIGVISLVAYVVIWVAKEVHTMPRSTQTVSRTDLSHSHKIPIWAYPDHWTALPTDNMINLWLEPSDRSETFLIKRVAVDSEGKETLVDSEPFENTTTMTPKVCNKIYLKASRSKGSSVLIFYENR